MNAAYSGYVYTHRLFHRWRRTNLTPEPYADYGGSRSTCNAGDWDAPRLDARDGFRGLYEQERDGRPPTARRLCIRAAAPL